MISTMTFMNFSIKFFDNIRTQQDSSYPTNQSDYQRRYYDYFYHTLTPFLIFSLIP